jgi:UDP-N-acetylmuramate dehydrogenase
VLTRQDVPLAPLTTLRVGGAARLLVEAETEQELVSAARARPSAFVLAGGSNVVLPDEGLDEVVLVRTSGVHYEDGCLVVQAGEDWDSFVASTVAAGLVGLEALSGIPGTVGASPIQNVGAYGAEVSSVIDGVRAYDRSARTVVELDPAACAFRYRTSALKEQPGRWVVLAVRFRLPEGSSSAPVRYAELAQRLGVAVGDSAPPADVRAAVLELRRGKGMVVDRADPDSVSAGSFFTNPVVAEAPEGAPSWPAEGGVKVSAAWLIEQAGYGKGWGDGPVGLSTKHALALVNRGGGTAAQVREAARVIRDAVVARFGITLTPEPLLLNHPL